MMQTMATNTLKLIPGTVELLKEYELKPIYTAFDREKDPSRIQFISYNDVIVGYCIVYERKGAGLYSLVESETDFEELEDWVGEEATYTIISCFEIWEEHQKQGFGSNVVNMIKEMSNYPIALYSVGESTSFWDKHLNWKSGYWYCES